MRMDALIPPASLPGCCRRTLAAAEHEWLDLNGGTSVNEFWGRLVSAASADAPGLIDHLNGLGRLCVASVPGFLDAKRLKRTCGECGGDPALIVISARLMAYGMQMGVAFARSIVGRSARGCMIDTKSGTLHESIRQATRRFFASGDAVSWMSDLESEAEVSLADPVAAPVLAAIAHGELWLCCHEMAHAYPSEVSDASFLTLTDELQRTHGILENRARSWAREVFADEVGLSVLSARMHGFALSVSGANGWPESPTEVAVRASQQGLLGATSGLLVLEGLEWFEEGYGRPKARLYDTHPPASIRRRMLMRSRASVAELFGVPACEPAETFERIWITALTEASSSTKKDEG